MAKWYGKVGYAIPTETSLGVWEHVITERSYYGDITRNSRRYQNTDKLNDDINISNDVRIVADPFAFESLQYIRYVEFMGSKWKVNNIEVQYPRLILSVGGIYNDQES